MAYINLIQPLTNSRPTVLWCESLPIAARGEHLDLIMNSKMSPNLSYIRISKDSPTYEAFKTYIWGRTNPTGSAQTINLSASESWFSLSSKINRGQKRAAGDGKLGLVETRAVESKNLKSPKIGKSKNPAKNHCFWARFWIVMRDFEKLLEKIFIKRRSSVSF